MVMSFALVLSVLCQFGFGEPRRSSRNTLMCWARTALAAGELCLVLGEHDRSVIPSTKSPASATFQGFRLTNLAAR